MTLQYDLFNAIFLGTPYMVTYYGMLGLSKFQVFALQSILSSVIVLGTVPSGWLADRFGRRRIIVAGAIVQLVNSTYFLQCRTFWQFAVSLVGTGIAASLLGGASTSLMMSSLRLGEFGKRRRMLFAKWRRQLNRRQAIAALVASVAGGFLVKHFGLHTPFVVQPLFYGVAVIIAWRLTEPTGAQQQRQPTAIPETARRLLRNPAVRWAIVLDAVVVTVLFVDFWLLQPSMKESRIGLEWFGLVYACRSVLMSASAYAAAHLPKISYLAGWSFFVAVAGAGSIIAGLEPNIVGTCAQIVVVSVLAINGILMDSYLEDRLHDDKNRTAELSIVHAIETMLFAAAGLALGKFSDVLSAHAALILVGILCLAGGGLALLKFRANSAL